MLPRPIQSITLASLAALACSQGDRTVPAVETQARASAEQIASPQAPDVTSFIEEELRARYGDLGGELRYFEGSVDLSGDGSPEILVYVVSPMLCGTGGCTTLVFTPEGESYRLVTEISVSRTPIQVLDRNTNGWRNLLVHVSGGGIQPGYDAELEFDGTTYPSNPTVEPARPATDTAGAEVVIADFESLTDAKPVPPATVSP